jgi:hypothetical protein
MQFLNDHIYSQKYCIISILSINNFPQKQRELYKDNKIFAVKFRGLFSRKIDAEKYKNILKLKLENGYF